MSRLIRKRNIKSKMYIVLLLGNIFIYTMKLYFIILLHGGDKETLRIFYEGGLNRFEIYIKEIEF